MNSKLKLVPVSGGIPQLLDEGPVISATWGSKGTIVFHSARRDRQGLVSMPAGGGSWTMLYEDPDPDTRRRYPNFLPDGEHFFFVSSSNKPELNGLYVGSTQKIPPIRLLEETTTGLYHPAGLVLFSRDGRELAAQPFDAETLTISGIAKPVINATVNLTLLIGGPRVSVATDGSIAYRELTEPDTALAWRKLSNGDSTSVGRPEPMIRWRTSQDGTRLLRIIPDPRDQASLNFVVEDLPRGVRSRAFGVPANTFGGGGFLSASGDYIYFSLRNGPSNRDLMRKPTSSGSKEELLYTAHINGAPLDVSRDGKLLLYGQGPTVYSELLALPLTGERKPMSLRKQENLGEARFSPDSGYFAFVDLTTRTQPEVFVQAVSGGEAVQVSVRGGRYPRWSSGGNEILFTWNGRLMSATIRKKPALAADPPRELFRLGPDGTESPFELVGDRILAADGQPTPSPVTVKLHWKP